MGNTGEFPGMPPDVRALIARAQGLTHPWQMQERVHLLEEALSCVAEEQTPMLWAALQDEMGNALQRIPTDDRRVWLARAIACYRAALRVRTEERLPAEWARTVSNLAHALCNRAALEAGEVKRATLEEAIAACRAALRIRTEAALPADWASTQNKLAIALRNRAELEAGETKRTTLEEAIVAYRASLRVYTEAGMPTDWAMTQNNLANALRNRAALEAGEVKRATLEEAIAACRAALQVYSEASHPVQWAVIQNNLGNVLWTRTALETNEAKHATLEEAIAAYRAALRIRTEERLPAEWAMTQNNLAVALWTRKALEVDNAKRATLEEAIAAFRAALRVRTEERLPADWALTQTNLAIALRALAALEAGEAAFGCLNEAIAAYRASLRVYTEESQPANWAATQNNLASALCDRAALEMDEVKRATLEEAIAACQAALRVFTEADFPATWATTQMNLAGALSDRAALETGDASRETQEEAHTAYAAALRYFRRDMLPTDYRNIARRTGLLYFRAGEWAWAADYFRSALDALDELFSLGVSAQGRAEALGIGSDLPALLAYALLRTGKPSVMSEAARALERGRARASGEAVARQQAALALAESQVPHALLDEFHIAAAAWAALAQGTTTLTEAHAQPSTIDAARIGGEQTRYQAALAARQRYDAAVKRVQAVVPGFLTSDDPLPSAVQALHSDERLVYVAATEIGALAVALAPIKGDAGEIEARAWHDEVLTMAEIDELLQRKDASGRVTEGLIPAQYRQAPMTIALEKAMQTLGASEGVLAQLAAEYRTGHVRRVVLVPGGLLGLLPLHAALVPSRSNGDERIPLQDVVCVSYAPSTRIWHACRERVELVGQQVPEVLVVGDPQPQPAAGSLAGAQAEAAAVRELVAKVPVAQMVPPERVLDTEAATYRAVLKALVQFGSTLTHVHFACHGVVEWTEPLRSGLLLANGARLMVRDLLDQQRLHFGRLRLAILSACQTGLPGTELPDEVVSLPSAWLQAGAAGVVGSLWPVSDSATVALMQKFYQLHLLDRLEPADALWLAQRWLRGLPRWREEFVAAGAVRAATGLDAPAVVTQLAQARGETYLLEVSDEDKTKPGDDEPSAGSGDVALGSSTAFANALHWAAFVYYGG